jgi:LmbE family N-acetylglucosaminyl deacetylase
MLPLAAPAGPLRVLCLGAHADDIEIGCGGTLLHWLAGGRRLTVDWVVFSASAEREREARAAAGKFLSGAAAAELRVEHFRDGYFPYDASLKDVFEDLKARPAPDVIFTHHRADRHQDHRTLSDLTWNTFRQHLILEYEIPKYDGDLGQPNCFVELPAAVCDAKITHLLGAFPSQRGKPWFTEDTFRGLLRLRGIESACPSGYAEAFHVRKLRLTLTS